MMSIYNSLIYVYLPGVGDVPSISISKRSNILSNIEMHFEATSDFI